MIAGALLHVLSWLLPTSALASSAKPPPIPFFADVTAAAGVDRPHHLRTFHNAYAEVMAGYTALGSAVAVADYDGDGREDLFVTDSAEGSANHLYRNLGGLRFSDVAAAAGVADGNDAHNASVDALFFDYDNDGRPDLLVVRFGRNQLFHNEGGGRYREVTREAGLDRYANGITAIALDYDRDGWLDLLVGNYFPAIDIFAPPTPRFFPASFETASNGGGVTLWHNLGGEPEASRDVVERGGVGARPRNNEGPRPGSHQVTFEDATERAGLAQSGWTLDVGAGDADNDGDLDLFVACDFGTDRFFLNRGNGTFTDRTSAAIGYDTKKGMNAEWGDFDGDGWLDVFVTNITDDYMREGNFLWRNDGAAAKGGPSFTDLAAETGTRDTGWGWGAKFLDYDLDGWLDLYVLNGWVSAGPENYVPDVFAMILRLAVEKGGDFSDARDWPPMKGKSLSGYQAKKLFHNEGGQLFSEQAARHGLASTRDGRGVAVADLDEDGRLDLFVTNAGASPFLYRGTVPPGPHWVELVLEGRGNEPTAKSLGPPGSRGSHRDAIGAQVRLTAGGRTQLRVVDPGNGFAAQGSRRLHFGLGEATTVDRAEVLWPSGLRQVLPSVAVDRAQRVVEGKPLEPALAVPGLASEPAAAPSAVAAEDCAATLDRFEGALLADPDHLRLGSDYRRAVIRCGAYDRALAFFAALTAAHPQSASAQLNYGYAYVDKIPTTGAISRVILANEAVERFGAAIAIAPSWLALFTRGNSYLYWPTVFGRTRLGIADLERAVAMGDGEGNKPYQVRAWIALGDGHWKVGALDEARAAWREGLRRFPRDPRLQARLARQDQALAALVAGDLDPDQRVDTDLAPLEDAPP